MKSGYRLAQMRVPDYRASSSSLEGLVKWWKDVWHLQLPSKIKIFFWKLCLDRLPTGDNLIQRGVDLSNYCVFCGKKEEDLYHLFWNYKWSKTQRLKSKLLNWSDFKELVVFLWGIWKRRNASTFIDGNADYGDLAVWVSSYVSSYRIANSRPIQGNFHIDNCRSHHMHQNLQHTIPIIWHPS